MLSIKNTFFVMRTTTSHQLRRYCKNYTDTQEWFIKVKDKPNHIRMGLTNEAIEQLTDIVYIDSDSIDKNKKYEKDTPVCEIESVKAVENLYAPVDGYITDFKTDTENLDNLNKEPENIDNWIIEMKTIC